MHEVGGVLVRRLVGRLDASTLVHGHVDDDRSRPHPGDHVVGHDDRRPAAGDQDRTDDEVGLRDGTLDRPTVRGESHDPALVDLVDPAQPVDVPVEQEDLGLHSLGDPRRVPADVAGADDNDAGRANTGDATEEDAPRPVGGLEEVSSDLGRDPSCDLAHRREEGQVARGELNRLVGDPGRLGSRAAPWRRAGRRRGGGR